MGTAAFFDFDRTLLAGSSGPYIAEHLRAQGLGPDHDVPGSGLAVAAFDRFGESPISAALSRASVRASKGWSTDAVKAAAKSVAPVLEDLILPFARLEIEKHRLAGRRVAIATTSPHHLLKPLAKKLDVSLIATRWLAEDGAYTGEVDGTFAWGRGKLALVKAWAEMNDIDLSGSYAYSDAMSDSPLLGAVGHPTAVNPDPALMAMARLQRWPIRWFDVPPGVVKFAGKELQDWFRPLATPAAIPYADIDISGLENIPSSGGAIIAFNHRSYFDATVVGMAIARSGRAARGLGKKEVFDAPIIGSIMRAVGGIRVDRGTGSDEPLRAAEDVLHGGELVMLAPEGTIPRGPAFFEPKLSGRWGAARLAAATGVPVVPLGLWGTENVWPRNQRFPSMTPRERPKVTVTVGQPLNLAGADLQVDTEAIMEALIQLLPAEARSNRTPTADELLRTFPPGYKGDPTKEVDRRPGTDT
jgi:putative phosphoserine phosphatase/1-acylglycerol-3-phosphate O-acyltransferase